MDDWRRVAFVTRAAAGPARGPGGRIGICGFGLATDDGAYGATPERRHGGPGGGLIGPSAPPPVPVLGTRPYEWSWDSESALDPPRPPDTGCDVTL